MYADHSPVPNHGRKVIVLEEGDLDVEEAIKMSRDNDTTTFNEGEIFWIVFADKPRRQWDFTERSLRTEFRSRNKAA